LINYISKFLVLSLDRYLCWWSIGHRGFHSSSR